MVVGVQVKKIQTKPLLQMPGSNAFYFRVMSMLKTKIQTQKKNNKKRISAVQHMANHFPSLELMQSAEHPHLSFT